MTKTKGKKIIQLPQSLDAKIRSRARNLKIGKCYITEGWDLMREGNIIITRLHTNGNITVGYFLVDLGLLGVKDAFYDFNVSEDRLLDILKENNEEGRFIEIDYELAHNIIYSAVEYAEDYGFKPCKEYAVAKYVLEEDDEGIPIIDVEFGVDGQPTVFCSDEHPMLNEIKQLEKTVGNGNFNVIYTDDDLGQETNFDEDYEGLMPGWDDDIDEMGVLDWDTEKWLDFFKQDTNELSVRVIQYYADMAFFELFGEDEVDAFKHVLGGAKYEDSLESIITDEAPKILDTIAEFMATDNPGDKIEEAHSKYPESLGVKLMWLAFVTDNYEKEDARQAFEDAEKQFPDNLTLLNMYSNWLIENDEANKVPGLYHNSYSLKKFNPDKVFTTNEVVDFCSSYCKYFLAVNDLHGAEPYYEVMDTIGDNNPVIFLILQDIVMAKMDYLYNLSNEDNTHSL